MYVERDLYLTLWYVDICSEGGRLLLVGVRWNHPQLILRMLVHQPTTLIENIAEGTFFQVATRTEALRNPDSIIFALVLQRGIM